MKVTLSRFLSAGVYTNIPRSANTNLAKGDKKGRFCFSGLGEEDLRKFKKGEKPGTAGRGEAGEGS